MSERIGLFASLALAARALAGPDAIPARLDLGTCLKLASENNASVEAAAQRILEAQARLRASKADRIPDVTLYDQHLKTTRDFPSFFSTPDYNHTVSAVLSQRLFSGGAIPAAIRASRAGLLEVEAAYRVTLEGVLARVSESYISILQERQTQEVLLESITTHERRIQDIQAKIDAGVMLETDRLQADLQLLEDQRALLVSQTSETLARDTLRVLLDLPAGAEPEFAPGISPLDRAELERLTAEPNLDSSPALHRLVARVMAAEAVVGSAKSPFKPTVDLKVTQFHVANGLAVFSADGDYTETMGVVTFPVFDGGKRDAGLDQARKGLEAAREEERTQRDELTIQVGQAILGIQEARARLRASTGRVTLADRNRSIVQDRYLQGAAVQSELLDADVAYRRAKLDEITSRFDIVRNQVKLLSTTGHMGEIALGMEGSPSPRTVGRSARKANP